MYDLEIYSKNNTIRFDLQSWYHVNNISIYIPKFEMSPYREPADDIGLNIINKLRKTEVHGFKRLRANPIKYDVKRAAVYHECWFLLKPYFKEKIDNEIYPFQYQQKLVKYSLINDLMKNLQFAMEREKVVNNYKLLYEFIDSFIKLEEFEATGFYCFAGLAGLLNEIKLTEIELNKATMGKLLNDLFVLNETVGIMLACTLIDRMSMMYDQFREFVKRRGFFAKLSINVVNTTEQILSSLNKVANHYNYIPMLLLAADEISGNNASCMQTTVKQCSMENNLRMFPVNIMVIEALGEEWEQFMEESDNYTELSTNSISLN